ncbi:hypothetical protein C7212DRAFT_354033 [Tuber magnatum]|uniref:G domain-containing protein n=1 Tax=Tuber magnatum TaxID=42249 RepID=A0A317SH31_9PEZI|nr:hypothetical protein C7212DRAFT_354033 [Tuber magnatum]
MNSTSESTHKTNSKRRGNRAGRGGRGTGSRQSEMLYTTEKHEADWYRMRSIVQQNDLDGFYDADYMAEKMSNLKIIHKDQINPYLLTADEEKAAKIKRRQNKQQLTVPRRPHWGSTARPAELECREKDSLLHWHRGLEEIQEAKDLMTPLERNLEISDLVVQIVDARNPLMSSWADYFEKEGISYRFFSTALAKQINVEYYSVDKEEEPVEEEEEEVAVVVEGEKKELRIRVLTVDELEVFLEHAPIVKDKEPESPRKTQIGLVGYSNVETCSTINALIGAKKVSVSSTPGKTKHFHTLHLGEKIVLCDCPGLVFPNFATTKAGLMQRGPTTLVAQGIPQQFLESLYGIKMHTHPFEGGGTRVPTGEELLMAYIPKDYVNGKFLFCHPAPNRIARASLGQDHNDDFASGDLPVVGMGGRSHDLHGKFFAEGRGSLGHMKTPFHLGFGAAGAPPVDPPTVPAKQALSGRKARTMIALDNNISPGDLRKAIGGKRHFKGRKNIKTGRSDLIRGVSDDQIPPLR